VLVKSDAVYTAWPVCGATNEDIRHTANGKQKLCYSLVRNLVLKQLLREVGTCSCPVNRMQQKFRTC